MRLFAESEGSNFERSPLSLILVDTIHNLVINHCRGVHAPLSVVPLNGLRLDYDCGLCKRHNILSRMGMGIQRHCRWCGGTVTEAVCATTTTHFSVSLDCRPF